MAESMDILLPELTLENFKRAWTRFELVAKARMECSKATDCSSYTTAGKAGRLLLLLLILLLLLLLLKHTPKEGAKI